MTLGEIIKRELHAQFPRKHFEITTKRDRTFDVKWADRSLPIDKVKRVVERIWFCMYGEKIKWGKIRHE